MPSHFPQRLADVRLDLAPPPGTPGGPAPDRSAAHRRRRAAAVPGGVPVGGGGTALPACDGGPVTTPGGAGLRILVVDNYDSFVFNLVQYLAQLGARCTVLRNDEVDIEEAASYDGVLLSPGPGTPERAGACIPLVERCAGDVPVLGVCLGHQAIAVAYGATVARAPELLHGKTSQVEHAGAGVLSGLPSPFTATRYHSLAVEPDTVPAELEVTGTTRGGVI